MYTNYQWIDCCKYKIKMINESRITNNTGHCFNRLINIIYICNIHFVQQPILSQLNDSYLSVLVLGHHMNSNADKYQVLLDDKFYYPLANEVAKGYSNAATLCVALVTV